MTISQFRSAEPLYIVVLRSANGNNRLKDWAKKNRQQVSIEGNRMKLFDQNSLICFQMTWTESWQDVSVWDVWNRRHIST
jgi:hypothetical protein